MRLNEAAKEIGADAVHLVDVHETRDLILIGLPPYGLGLGFDPGHRVENGQHDQGFGPTQAPGRTVHPVDGFRRGQPQQSRRTERSERDEKDIEQQPPDVDVQVEERGEHRVGRRQEPGDEGGDGNGDEHTAQIGHGGGDPPARFEKRSHHKPCAGRELDQALNPPCGQLSRAQVEDRPPHRQRGGNAKQRQRRDQVGPQQPRAGADGEPACKQRCASDQHS